MLKLQDVLQLHCIPSLIRNLLKIFKITCNTKRIVKKFGTFNLETLNFFVEYLCFEILQKYIPFENDNAMIKGVELLLDKGKESEFTSVVISK